jgi:CRISPR-associated protein Cas10/Cmr2 subtype III-B
MAPSTPTLHLLRFQIGPVQDFIAQARSTRDLWSGSYLLSWLVAAGIQRFLKESGAALIFPNREGQPLLDASLPLDAKKLLTPNLPNIFVGTVHGDAEQLAREIRDAIQAEWRFIADSVWEQRKHFDLHDGTKDRFFAQVKRHLSILLLLTSHRLRKARVSLPL